MAKRPKKTKSLSAKQQLRRFVRKFGVDEIDQDPRTLTAYIDAMREYAEGQENQLGNSDMRLSKQMRDRWYARTLNISEEELAKEKERWEKRQTNFGSLSYLRRGLRPKEDTDLEAKYFQAFKGQLCSVELECVFEDKDNIPNLRQLGRMLIDKEDDGSLEWYPDRDRDEERNEDDGDSEDPDWGSAEFKVTFRHERPLRLKGVVDKLNASGAEVNTSCGMHLHLDQRGVSSAMASKRAKRLIKCLPALASIVAPSRLDNRYCRMNRPIHRGFTYRHSTDRYLAINHASAYCEHTTTENRLHGGTLDFWKIMGWVDLNKWIVTSSEVDEVAEANSHKHGNGILSVSLEDIIKMRTLPETIRAYLWRRYRQFHSQDALKLRDKMILEDKHRLTDGYAVS